MVTTSPSQIITIPSPQVQILNLLCFFMMQRLKKFQAADRLIHVWYSSPSFQVTKRTNEWTLLGTHATEASST